MILKVAERATVAFKTDRPLPLTVESGTYCTPISSLCMIMATDFQTKQCHPKLIRGLVTKLHETDECFNYAYVANTCVYNVQIISQCQHRVESL